MKNLIKTNDFTLFSVAYSCCFIVNHPFKIEKRHFPTTMCVDTSDCMLFLIDKKCTVWHLRSLKIIKILIFNVETVFIRTVLYDLYKILVKFSEIYQPANCPVLI